MKQMTSVLAHLTSLRCFILGFIIGTVVGYAAFRNDYLSGSLFWSAVGFLAGVVVGYIIRIEVTRHQRDHS